MANPPIPVNLTVTDAGFQNTSPAVINQNFIQYVTQLAPGFTANLPGSLVEDMVSTATGAIVQIDNLCVELGNSISPFSANPWIMLQLGSIYGVPLGVGTNTSVFVVFTGTVGFSINPGFTVGDGTNQYVVQEGSIIPVGGVSAPIFCLANAPGSWAVPVHTVTQLVTSVPGGITLSVTNNVTGVPGLPAQAISDYQAQVYQAGLAAAQGMPTLLKTLLGQVAGVQQRLVSVRQKAPGWEIIVGGGDPYQVADAIFHSLFDISNLVGSTTTARNITVNIIDSPDTYAIIFVNPPQQTVVVQFNWSTTSPNFVSPAAVSQLSTPAIVSYINSIPVGQPINLFDLQHVFHDSVSSVLPLQYISNITTTISINGVATPPTSGTFLIPGDPESYFYTTAASVTVTQV